MKPVVLELSPLAPDEKVVALARDLLEGAESGKIQALAAAWEALDPDHGRSAYSESRGDGTWTLVGGLAMLQSDVINALRDAARAEGEGEG